MSLWRGGHCRQGGIEVYVLTVCWDKESCSQWLTNKNNVQLNLELAVNQTNSLKCTIVTNKTKRL